MRTVKAPYERTRVQTDDMRDVIDPKTRLPVTNAETGEILREKRVSKTQQHHVKNTNINAIMKRFERTGVLPVRVAQPLEGPLPDVESFHEAMNIVIQGRQAFEQLPSDIREEFKNSPEVFLKAFGDESQHERLRELKLLPALPPAPAPEPTEPPA